VPDSEFLALFAAVEPELFLQGDLLRTYVTLRNFHYLHQFIRLDAQCLKTS
jgi:hypothetical protein